MSDRKAAGESLSRRIASRHEDTLQRRDMPDGGAVYTGPLARRALRAVGARAMTMDHTIFVDDSFDVDNPEDQALYAHERVHDMGSGGVDDSHGPRDAEEIAARAIERMVLHRAQAGESFGAIMRDVATKGASAAGGFSAGGGGGGEMDMKEAEAAFAAMLAKGLTHEQIVKELTRFVVRKLSEMESESHFRTPTSKFL